MTPRRQEMLDYIVRFRAEHGYSPTIREIGVVFDIGSPNGVVASLTALKKLGAITFEPTKARSIVPTQQAETVSIDPKLLADVIDHMAQQVYASNGGLQRCHELVVRLKAVLGVR